MEVEWVWERFLTATVTISIDNIRNESRLESAPTMHGITSLAQGSSEQVPSPPPSPIKGEGVKNCLELF